MRGRSRLLALRPAPSVSEGHPSLTLGAGRDIDSYAESGLPVSRSYASRYFARVRATTSAGSSGGGLFLSQPLASSQTLSFPAL